MTGQEQLDIIHSVAPTISFASVHCGVSPIKCLTVHNGFHQDINGLTLSVSSQPEFFRERSWQLDVLQQGTSQDITDTTFEPNIEQWGRLNEAELGELNIFASLDGNIIYNNFVPVRFVSRHHWGGTLESHILIATHVLPNDGAVANILKNASQILKNSGCSDILDGYSSQNLNHPRMIAASIWTAVAGLNLNYVLPPVSFEEHGQRTRPPNQILNERLATCLDSSLLLAAAWEQAGLNPIILFSEGHAFAGVWTINCTFDRAVEYDPVSIRKHIQSGEIFVLETTLLTKRPTSDFITAAKEGMNNISEEKEHDFISAVDVTIARTMGVRPLSSSTQSDDVITNSEHASIPTMPSDSDFGPLPDVMLEAELEATHGKVDLWKSKLLDLTQSNKLLNFRQNKQTLPCIVPDIGDIEDKIASGKKFRFHSITMDEAFEVDNFQNITQQHLPDGYLDNLFSRNKIAVPLDEKDMNSRLLNLYRKAKSNLQEGGANTLFLAVGFLRWRKDGESKFNRAPLLLIPVKMTRKSVRSEFVLEAHGDETRFNSTLLEMLKRDFELKISILESDLPRDKSGIDVRMLMHWMRNEVKMVKDFEIVEGVEISVFTFVKYLMWKELSERTSTLSKNSLVARLIGDEDNVNHGNAGQLDKEVIKGEHRIKGTPDLLTTLPADNSQINAIKATKNGDDFVLIGPPGTGKSQTIANIIGQCVADDKTVLFVSEKTAALEVVLRRLRNKHLDSALLELHSNKADRSLVVEQLYSAWTRRLVDNDESWKDACNKLNVIEGNLNSYVKELHDKRTQGFSVFEAISWASRDSHGSGATVSYPSIDSHDEESFLRLITIANELETSYFATLDCPRLPLIKSTEWSNEWADGCLRSSRDLLDTVNKIIDVSKVLSNTLALTPDENVSPTRFKLLESLMFRVRPDSVDLKCLMDRTDRKLLSEAKLLRKSEESLNSAMDKASARYSDDSIRRMNLEDITEQFNKATGSFWPLSWYRKARLRRILQAFTDVGVSNLSEDIPALLEAQKHLTTIDNSFLTTFAGDPRSMDSVEGVVNESIKLRAILQEIRAQTNDDVTVMHVVTELVEGPSEKFLEIFESWTSAWRLLKEATSNFEKYAGEITESISLVYLKTQLSEIVNNDNRLREWISWTQVCHKAKQSGLENFTVELESGKLSDGVETAFKKAYANWWLPLAIDSAKPLRDFIQWKHENILQQFRSQDKHTCDLAPAEILSRIPSRLPRVEDVSKKSGLGALRHQMGLERKSMSIRHLLDNLKNELQLLTPCVMMSPLSIAQYLPSDLPLFDVVIFDEASQITTWDAVGAIARGKQTIVVGDPKQLPPTNFFERGEFESEESHLQQYLRDMPSILEEAQTAGVYQRMLNTHYRSRDESLIAFSNFMYYDDELNTFPSTNTKSSSVHLHQVNGKYARGRSRTNLSEALEVTRYAKQVLTNWLDLPETKRPSLGVITFNQSQQELILNHFDNMRKEDGRLEWFFHESCAEPVIVKNLESIQGDERDVILFSTTFGPGSDGKFTMNFGPLNLVGGERRLNVAVTRARSEMHVFTSIHHDQIDLHRVNKHAKGVFT